MDLLWPQVTVDDLRQSRRNLEAALADPIGAQWTFLERLLASRANTVIGRELGLASIKSLADFRRVVPITPYDDKVRALVERIKHGEEDVLFPGRAYHFTRTTGTTGTPKDIPLSSEYRDDVLAAAGPFFATIEDAYPGGLAQGFGLTGSWREELTPAGIGLGQPTGAARCVFAKLGFFDWAPEAVFEIRDFQLRYYTLLYFALNRDIRIIFVLSPSTLTMLFGKAEEFAAQLADDLEDGAFRRGPGDIAALHGVLDLPPANPAAARRLRDMMATSGRFEPVKVWPNLQAISAWKGEGSAHHLEEIRARSPGVAMWPMHTGSSESALFVPIHRDWNGGLPALLSTFYEFYPEDAEPSEDTFVPLTELEVGKTYRTLLTNGRGMFRYPITDVYKVEGKYRGVPIVAYSHRVATVSVVGEKLTEAQVVGAMTHAGALSATLSDYQLAPIRVGTLDAYVLLLEYRTAPPPVEQLRASLARFEEGLIQQNWLFGKYRTSALAPTRLAVVPPGTFEQMRRAKSDGKRNDSQYKDPHLRGDVVDLAALRPLHVVGEAGELPLPAKEG